MSTILRSISLERLVAMTGFFFKPASVRVNKIAAPRLLARQIQGGFFSAMRCSVCVVASLVCAAANAVPVIPGGNVSVSIDARASIYGVEGNVGSTFERAGEYVQPAVEVTFASGVNQLFSIDAAGSTNCCSSPTPNWSADGAGANTSVSALNGLSASVGNSQLGLLGVFTDGTNPFGMSAPATLNWDRNNPLSLAPSLRQVFYIGDGRSGYNNSGGSLLEFLAPADATKLFLGFADSWAFNGSPSYFGDNTGNVNATISLQGQAVPEPATLVLIGFGLAGLGFRREKEKGAKG